MKINKFKSKNTYYNFKKHKKKLINATNTLMNKSN